MSAQSDPESGADWDEGKEKAIILKIGVRGDVRNRCRGHFLSTGSGLPIANESRFRQILSDLPGA
jgi:hypothetical protein